MLYEMDKVKVTKIINEANVKVGDEGYITKINHEMNAITVRFDDETWLFEEEELEKI